MCLGSVGMVYYDYYYIIEHPICELFFVIQSIKPTNKANVHVKLYFYFTYLQSLTYLEKNVEARPEYVDGIF